MAILKFSLTPEATIRVYEILVCLSKFGETLAIEAKSDKFTLTALNNSKTAYASFALDSKSFFLNYEFSVGSTNKAGERFTCQLLNRALQSVFKGRANDFRGRDAAIERCDVSVQDQPDKTECRLVVKMICKHGMTKVYRLTYESAEVMHALFDSRAALQAWKVSARVLREYIEFFGPKTEQLDLVATDGKAVFTSFTEKIQNGKEVLKQPLETAISIHKEDFDNFHVQEDMHVVISVKDFKAIVTHAETLRSSISARFSYPSRPLQFTYQNFGIYAEFTLMTSGDLRGASSAANPNFITTRANSQQPSFSAVPAPSALNKSAGDMPPPLRPPASRPLGSRSQHTPSQSGQERAAQNAEADPESLFVPNVNEDRAWDPPNYDHEEEEEMLGWDTSLEHPSSSFHPTFRDTNTQSRGQGQRQRPSVVETENRDLEPTQPLSQLHGMFD